MIAAILLTLSAAVPVGARPGQAGFRTSEPSMLVPARADVTTLPIITVGETLNNGYRFEAIPDGIALRTRGQGRVDVFVNHETSKVPFPATLTDFDNAQVSQLTLNQQSAGVTHGSYVIPSSANYQRFCSSFLATAEHGFDREILFTNEETSEFFNRSGEAWPPEAGSNRDQGGLVVALDLKSGAYRAIPGMGRHNHENSVAIPGYNELALLSGDDTFSSNPPSSQVYLYTAADTDAVWNDEGSLWAFKAAGTDDDYYDVTTGETLTGTFILVPPDVAVGDQTALESWSNTNGVFRFIRIEDIAYDRGNPHVVYMADSGRGSVAAPNGRIWRFQLNPANPRVVDSLTILVDGDPLGSKHPDAIHQPDNLETTAGSLFVTEDPSSGNQFAPADTDTRRTTARVWRVDLANPATKEIVLRVDQRADPAANLGSWEASGIVDASSAFGPDAFLIDVQAHSLFVETTPHPLVPTVTQKREGGQLLLVRIPDA